MKFAVIGTWALILAALPSPTLAASTASIERKVERAEKELSQKQGDLKKKRAELVKARVELGRVGKKDAEEKEARTARVADIAEEVRLLEDEARSAEDALSRLEDVRERAEAKDQKEKMAASRPATGDCVSCATGRASAPNQGQSTWDGIAQVLKAVTPLGVAGMGTWLNYQGMRQQSSNYQFYAGSMLSQGLPISAPSSYFGGSGFSSMSSIYGAAYGMGSSGGYFGMPSFSYGGYGYPSYFGSFPAFGTGMPVAYPLTNSSPTVASAYRL